MTVDALVEQAVGHQQLAEGVLHAVHRLLRVGHRHGRLAARVGPAGDDRAGFVVETEDAARVVDVVEPCDVSCGGRWRCSAGRDLLAIEARRRGRTGARATGRATWSIRQPSPSWYLSCWCSALQ